MVVKAAKVSPPGIAPQKPSKHKVPQTLDNNTIHSSITVYQYENKKTPLFTALKDVPDGVKLDQVWINVSDKGYAGSVVQFGSTISTPNPKYAAAEQKYQEKLVEYDKQYAKWDKQNLAWREFETKRLASEQAKAKVVEAVKKIRKIRKAR